MAKTCQMNKEKKALVTFRQNKKEEQVPLQRSVAEEIKMPYNYQKKHSYTVLNTFFFLNGANVTIFSMIFFLHFFPVLLKI